VAVVQGDGLSLRKHSCKVLSRGIPTPHDQGVCELNARRRVADCWVRGVCEERTEAGQMKKRTGQEAGPIALQCSVQTWNIPVPGIVIESVEYGKQSARKTVVLACVA
jgi:hypothetical protein